MTSTRPAPQSGAGHNGIGAETASLIAGDLLTRLGVAPGDAAALAAVTSGQLLEAQAALTAEVMTSGKIDLYGAARPRYTPSQRPTLLFATKCDVVENPNADELALWDGVL